MALTPNQLKRDLLTSSTCIFIWCKICIDSTLGSFPWFYSFMLFKSIWCSFTLFYALLYSLMLFHIFPELGEYCNYVLAMPTFFHPSLLWEFWYFPLLRIVGKNYVFRTMFLWRLSASTKEHTQEILGKGIGAKKSSPLRWSEQDPCVVVKPQE